MKPTLKSTHIRALDYLTRMVPGSQAPAWRKPDVSFDRCCAMLWREKRDLVQFDQAKGYRVTAAGAAVARAVFSGSAAA